MTKKLFVVEVVYEAYVWAEDDVEACYMDSEIARTELFPKTSAREVQSNVLGWEPDACVYNSEGKDIELRDALINFQVSTPTKIP